MSHSTLTWFLEITKTNLNKKNNNHNTLYNNKNKNENNIHNFIITNEWVSHHHKTLWSKWIEAGGGGRFWEWVRNNNNCRLLKLQEQAWVGLIFNTIFACYFSNKIKDIIIYWVLFYIKSFRFISKFVKACLRLMMLFFLDMIWIT